MGSSRIFSYLMIMLFILPIFTFDVAFSPPPISKLWLDADTVIQGIVDAINLVNHTDLYDVYNVWVIVAEYLQDYLIRTVIL